MKPTHTILLVEDNPADITILQRALRETEFAVELIVLRDGQEALDYLFRCGPHADDPNWRCPDLILLDLNLPRVGGHEVLVRIRSRPGLNTIPVVVLSTSRRQEDVRAVYAAGGNTYFEKPQDFAKFVQVLQTIRRYWLEMAILPVAGRV